MRVLGIDIGMKRTGLALSDELGLSVGLLPNLQAKNKAEALEKILSLVSEFEIKVIVIGLPTSQSSYGKAVISRVMGLYTALSDISLENNLALKVVLLDESYTSKLAMAGLVASGVSQKKRRQKLDSASAAILVEDYLSFAQNQG